MILLAGGTGVLGRAIGERVVASGRAVRILTRDPSRASSLAGRPTEIAVADLEDPASLQRAIQGVTHVITTANAFINPARDAVERLDVRGNRHLIDAAVAAGVRQFVFTSVWLPDAYLAIDYFAAKRRTEEYLRASGLTYTILQPTAFMETWAMVVGEPILRTGKTQIFGDGKNPVNFVAVDEVAAIAVMALDHPAALNAEVRIGGPENLTLLEVAAIFERIRGTPAKKQHLPVPVLKLLSMLVRPFNPVFARQVNAGALMASVPQAVDGMAPRAKWDVPMTRLEEWARQRYSRSAASS